jgi:hypothetical protein
MRRIALIASVGMLIAASATPVSAQNQERNSQAEPTQVLSASPFLWMFKWMNVDYERKIAPAVTLGASASFLPSGGDNYGRATFHARFYPQRTALTGFYLGAQAGMHQVHAYRDDGVFFGAGMDLGYAWLLGPKHDVSVSLGFGSTRLFAGPLHGESIAIPNVRAFNVGFAF